MNLSPDINCFVGKNGMGKTNVLDAVYYLSNCKSFFNSSDSQNINFDEDFFVVQGDFTHKGEENIYCGVKRGKKKVFKRGKNQYEKLSEHIGLIQTVLISPIDANLIIEGSEIRRKYIDHIISQNNKQYLKSLISYNRALSQRNSLLKHFIESRTFDTNSLEVWDDKLVSIGTEIFTERKKFMRVFNPLFLKIHKQITSNNESVSLTYRSQLLDENYDKILKSSLQKDRYSGYTTVGIHRDDFLFELGTNPLKKIGSQGQQKSYVTALKMAHFKYIEKESGKKPILLLDDIYDKLDEERIENLMNSIVSGEYGQVFLTDTDQNRLNNFFNKKKVDHHVYLIENGELKEQIS